MTTINAFIKRHPVLTYFTLTFAISWGGLLLVSGGPDGFPNTKEQFERLLPLFIPVVLAGPSVAGILLTALVYGRGGFRGLLSRLFMWRVGIRWHAVAFLTAPLVLMAVMLALSLTSLDFIPGIFAKSNKVSLLLMGIVAGLVVGFFEELGVVSTNILPGLSYEVLPKKMHSISPVFLVVSTVFYWLSQF